VKLSSSQKSSENPHQDQTAELKRLSDALDAEISARAELQISLDAEQQHREGILNSVADAVVTIDEHGLVQSFNPASIDMFGYQADEVIGKNVCMLMPNPDRDKHDGYIENYRETGRGKILGVGVREITALHKDGHEIPAELSVGELIIGGQRIFIGSMRDITERKLADQTNRESEERYRQVIENAPYAIIVTTWDGIMQFANQAAVDLFGADSADQFIGKDNLILLHPDHHANAMTRRDTILQGRILNFVERKRFRFDGSEFISESSGSHCVWNDESAVLIGIRDISDRVATEERLRASEERYGLVANAANDGIWDWNLLTNEAYRSARWWEILGYTENEILPRVDAMAELFHPDDQKLVMLALEDHIKNHIPFDIEYRIRQKSGVYIWVRTKGQALWDENGKAYRMAGSTGDISVRKSVEEEFRQAQKMEAVGQLTGGIAHDFNNLLTVIQGNVDLAIDRLDGAANVAPLLERANKAAMRGALLTHRLLAFSRKQALMPDAIDAGKLLSEMIDLMQRTLGANVETTMELADDLWKCHADPGQLENAILNLSINARDAMPSGGKLTLKTENFIHIDDTNGPDLIPGHYVMIDITDSGTGMPQDVIDHVFEPFYTTKETGQGSGLGLSMVYGFVKQSGGDVTIRSLENIGTTVSIFLPKATGSDDTDDINDRTDEPRGRGETVLVVEDDADVRAMTIALLEDLGYNSEEAENSDAAFLALEENPAIGLVLSDVMLPGGMNGPEIGAKAVLRYPNLRILYMSGYTADTAIHKHLSEQQAELINKPFQRADFAQKLRKILDKPANKPD
jgi:PAS domain S-box-containing protein